MTESKPKKLSTMQLYLLVFIILSVISVATSLFFEKEEIPVVQESDASSLERFDTKKSAPSVVNIPPKTVKAGERYQFTFRLSDKDTELADITMEIVQAPEWIVVSGFEVAGVPQTVEDSGRVVVIFSDGLHNVTESFYIEVTPGE